MSKKLLLVGWVYAVYGISISAHAQEAKPTPIPAAPAKQAPAQQQGEAKPALAPEPYTLSTKVWGITKTGEKKVLAQPTLATLDGRPASFQFGGELPIRNPKTQTVDYLSTGTTVRAVVHRVGNEKLRIDVAVEVTSPGTVTLKDDEGLIETRSRTVRLIRTIEPGKQVTLAVASVDGDVVCYWLELTVSESEWEGQSKTFAF